MTNVIKFQAPFERIKLYNQSPEVSLRKAVITQAIIDATNISSNKLLKKFEIEAKLWIFGGSDEFKSTCFEANLEPCFVIRLTKEIISLHKKANRESMRKSARNISDLKNKLHNLQV